MRIPNVALDEQRILLFGTMLRLRFALRLLIAITTLFLLATPSSSSLRAQDSSSPTGYLLAQSEEQQVWVNTATGVYHYPGTRWFGNTKQGKLMSEKDAIAQGYLAARNGP
jgi:hypothetical protein